MPTKYSDVTNQFIGMVTEYRFFKILKEERDEWLCDLMKVACAKFRKICRHDLSDRDDELQQFNVELDDDEIDIICNLMICEWLKPKLFSVDNLEQVLNTKDYSEYSPANLLKEISSVYKEHRINAKCLQNNYSFSFQDINDVIESS